MKKTIMYLVIGMALMLFYPAVNLEAQPEEPGEESNFSLGVDLVSRYVWRGINLGGSSPHVQPYLEYAFGNSGLVIGAWGSYSLGFGTAGTEADLFISYSPMDALTFTVTNYYFPSDEPFGRDNYFDYDNETTGHTFEGMVTFNGTESIPFYATFAMNFHGADGLDEDGEPYFAKYLEVGYTTSKKGFDFDLFLGFALDNPDVEAGAVGWYGNSAGVINLGLSASRALKLGNAKIPVSSSLIVNPEAEIIYLVFGVSF